jgi:hypothetical protein
MFSRVFIAILSLAAAGIVAAQAYKWVDEGGVVHYSDRPQPGAERIELPRSPASSAARTPTRPSTPAAAPASEPDEPAPGYESLTIVSPGAEETLWNIAETLNVTVRLEPGLQSGHQIRAYFDGEPQMVSGTFFTIEEVYRGVHNIQVEVVDEAGQLKIRSQTNRFYVQQNSVSQLQPANPSARPRPRGR